jgi:hypothetical protein
VKRLTASAEDHLPGSPFLNDLKENAETLYFATDEIMEDVNNLLSLGWRPPTRHQRGHAGAHRLLGLLPALTFIVGIYGMNFDVMPELPLGLRLSPGAGVMGKSAWRSTWFHRRAGYERYWPRAPSSSSSSPWACSGSGGAMPTTAGAW